MTPFQQLKEKLLPLIASASMENPLSVVRVSVPADGYDPLSWLAACPLFPKFFSRSAADGTMLAAAGAALALTSTDRTKTDGQWDMLREILAMSPGYRFYGGMSFNPAVSSAEWAPYRGWSFFLPSIEMHQDRQGKITLSASVFLAGGNNSDTDAFLNILERMPYCEKISRDLPALIEQDRKPVFDEWERTIHALLNELHAGHLSGIVCARQTQLTADENIDPFILLDRLLDQPGEGFLYQPVRTTAFLGVSPEMIYQRRHRELTTMALAGTRPRNGEPLKDALLAADLQHSPKDHALHREVVQAISTELNLLCASFKTEEKKLLSLPRQFHLVTDITGDLRPDIDDQRIMEVLFPTPGLAGIPRETAMKRLQATEAFDRGWFAGGIGWISRDETVMAAGIRSCLIDQHTLYAYAGAVIAPDADPRKKWEEGTIKMSSVTRIFQEPRG